MTEFGPVGRQAAVQAAEQQHQLGAVDTVPQEGGQQEEVKQGRHRRARPRVWLHVLLGGQHCVGLPVGHCGDFILSAGVSHSWEEGDDEGQQGDVNAEKHDPRLDASFWVSREFAKTKKFRRIRWLNTNTAQVHNIQI